MAIDKLMIALTGEDDYDDLIAAAIDIAEPSGATVVLGRVYDEGTHSSVGRELNISTPDELAERDEEIAAVVASLEEAGLTTEIRAAVGDGGEPFVAIAERAEVDMVLIQGETRSPAGKAVFGSVPQAVLLNAPCPVTFIRR